jgi:hypothetical protein
METMRKWNCLCGRQATHTAYLPAPNIFARCKQVMEPHRVCEYHAARAKLYEYAVEEGVKL